jgi:beta-mannanase
MHKALFVVLSLFIIQAIKAQPVLGVYDYVNGFTKASGMIVDEQFVDWYPYTNGTVASYIGRATALNRTLLLTVQPEVNPSIGKSKTLLTDVTAGKYDSVIKQLCTEIKSQGKMVYIRWGHEMETAQGRYPWSGQSPSVYIPAFQHVVTLMRSLAPLCLFVWSPQGQSNALQYWVGSAFCDEIGFSVYSYREYDIAEYGTPQTFKVLMDARYNIAYRCNPSAPVMICEMGAYSSKQKTYQASWVETALSLMPYYPELKVAVYFNAPDSVKWSPAGIPSFTTTPAIWNTSYL